MTTLSAARRRAIDHAHAIVVSAIRQVDQARQAIDEALGEDHMAGVHADHASVRLHAAREAIEQALGTGPASFDEDHITYDVVTQSDLTPPRRHTVFCDDKEVGAITVDDPNDPLWNDAIAAGRRVVRDAIGAGTWSTG